jgi:hypothetical protein
VPGGEPRQYPFDGIGLFAVGNNPRVWKGQRSEPSARRFARAWFSVRRY